MDLHDYLRAGWRLLFLCGDKAVIRGYLTHFDTGVVFEGAGYDMMTAMDNLCRKLKKLEVKP